MGCKKYQLSLDGLRETHDAIRRPGSWDETMAVIPMLRRAGITVAIMATVSRWNVAEIPALVDVAAAHAADIFTFARYCPSRADRDTTCSPQAYRALLEQCWEKYQRYEAAGCKTAFLLKDHLWTLFLYEKGLFTIDQALDSETIYGGCNCGNCHMTILSDGAVYACRRMESKVGNALTDDLYSLFTGDAFEQYRQYDRFEKCARCELLRFCRGCPAVAAGYHGNLYAPDPQCWEGNRMKGKPHMEDTQKSMMETILHRRAIRRFETRQIEEPALQQILQAGLYAPSAGGRQGVLFAVCQNGEINRRLGRIKRANAHPQMATATSYVSREQPSIADDPKLTDAFYNAPTVITLFAPKHFLFAAEDCAVAAENMMLAADVLGIGSCYIGQGWTAFADPFGQEILRQWGIRTDYYAVMQLLLGYPRAGDTHPTPKPRRGDRVLRF